MLVDDRKVPHQLSLGLKLSLEKFSVYGQLKRMCYILLELETLLVVPSHTKTKIGNSVLLSIRLIEYMFLLKSPKIYIFVSFVLIFENCSVIVSIKLPWLGRRQIVPTTRGFESGKKISMNIFSISEERNNFAL